MRIAQIMYNKVHWIFEQDGDALPDWPPDAEGNPILLVDITGHPEICEGWDYDAETESFTEPEVIQADPIPELEPQPTAEELERAEILLTLQEVLINQQGGKTE